jgi:hypothetical protein
VMGVSYSSGRNLDDVWSLFVFLWTELRQLDMVSYHTPMDLVESN